MMEVSVAELPERAVLGIRPVGQDDAMRVNKLLGELGYPYSTDEDVAARIANWSAREDLLTLVAVYEERVVGVVALAVIPYFERRGSWGRIVAIVVDAHSRGLKVGRQLMEAAEQAARTRGCISMEVSSARRRTDAHAFYRALGYTDWCDKGARFLKDLVPGASDQTYANH
jgi:GNAT superfamily N-acetyltransferase